MWFFIITTSVIGNKEQYSKRAIRAYNDSTAAASRARDAELRVEHIIIKVPEDEARVTEITEIIPQVNSDIEESQNAGNLFQHASCE